MYLRELRINGFKSFADPTRLDLQRGTTAIVGPNGCGKSNIADAIRWVLGEQSAKSLRAGAMQDVIFQGAATRKPVNLCEVTLVFTECEDRLGTAYHEVEVTRRVIRDGGSEYLLNGKQCRLKDIQRLFLDTGVGQVSYSFMLQGQIDQVLSSNPSERRAIFEEAAGISKYKAQRRESLNKLGQVDTNLARVTDVIEEVGRQIGSLKRQASKALRYKRVRHRLTHLDLALNGHNFGKLIEQIEEIQRKCEFLGQRAEKLATELASEEEGLSSRRQSRNQLSNRLQELQKDVYDVRSKKEAASSKVEFSSVRKEDLIKRIQQIQVELKELESEQKIIAEKLAGETQLKQEQMDLFGNTDEIFKAKSQELATVQGSLAEAETQLARSKHALTAKEGSISRLRSNCTSLELDLKTYQVRHATLTEEIRGLSEESELLSAEREKLERARIARSEEKQKQEQRIQELKEAGVALTKEFREMQRRLQETDREMAGLQAQIRVLQDLQAKFEGFSEGAKAILQGKLGDKIHSDDYSLFLKRLQVEAKYTKPLELLLGFATDGILLKDVKRVSPVSVELRDKKHGRASLLFQPPQGNVVENGIEGLPNWLIPAESVLSSEDPSILSFVSQFLSGCYFADDLEQFIAFWLENPKFSFHFVVTEAGELIDTRGLILAGANKKEKGNASFLARENQLKRHNGQLNDFKERHESLKLQAEQIQGKIDGVEKQIDDQRSLVNELSQEVSTLAAQRQGAQRNLEQSKGSLLKKEEELKRLELSKDASTNKLDQATKELQETEGEIATQKELIDKWEKTVVEKRDQRDQMRESFNEAKLEIAEKKQRLQLLDKGLDTLKSKSSEVSRLKIKQEEEVKQLTEQIEKIDTEAAVAGKEIKELEGRLNGLMESLEKDRSALKEIERSIQVVEDGFKARRDSHQKMTSELNKEEVNLARLQSRSQFLIEEIEREYELHPRDIKWKESLWAAGDGLPDRIKVDIDEESPEDMEILENREDPTQEDLDSMDSTNWDEIDEEVKSLRGRIQAMGPVNLVAIEEYKSLKERHEFLKVQSDDLWQSKDQLVKAIDEINTKSQELFANTFKEIRKNFHYTFETLFGGGKSDLQLVDTEDVLESGIDISAQPPGTRLKSLALLSGGQKTMTAVALLFAIYMVKPSPFCVLDEIDAPLDDANIGRFTKMLESFLEYSQFLIITHNKRTISVADTIYGATMQEKGVSKVVSMRFNKGTGVAETVEIAG